MECKQLCSTMAVREQLTPADMAAAAAAGYRSIVNNRPDGEQPGQPSSAELAQAAQAAGLEYRHIPVVPGQITEDAIAAFDKALGEMPAPVLGFCKTGMRAATLWGTVQAPKLGADGAIEAAAAAGCDISGARALLERCAG